MRLNNGASPNWVIWTVLASHSADHLWLSLLSTGDNQPKYVFSPKRLETRISDSALIEVAVVAQLPI